MEEALSVFRNTRNESGYSPNQLFFLRNWRDHNLPGLRPEPTVEEMVKARDRVRGGCYKVRKDESSLAWPRLFPGDMVRGQHPETKELSIKGQVLEMVHGDRAVNEDLDEGAPRLFVRDAMRKDTTRTHQDKEEEELSFQLVGTVGGDMPETGQGQMEESRSKRSKRRKPNLEDVGPRRSLRLAKKKVTVGLQETVHDPEVLPYYMAAVESGYPGTRQNTPRVLPEEEEQQEGWCGRRLSLTRRGTCSRA